MKRTLTSFSLLGSLVMGTLLSACQANDEAQDTVSAGEITVAVDESLRPVMEAQEAAFEATRKYAKINSVYITELKAIELMLNDSARVAVVTRQLNDSERRVFEESKLKYRSIKIATDAVALITHPANADTLISTDELAQVLAGRKSRWSDLGRKGANERITVVFDNNNSGNLNYLFDTLQVADRSKAPVFAVKSNEEVIEFVKKNKNAMGIIGVNWISDIDDPKTPRFMEGIRIMGVARRPEPEPADYYQPFQYAIALQKYPLCRHVYMITKEARRGLGTGYINYVVSDRGQRIVLKAGLLPATQIIRLVNTRGTL
jgi:phosphate transport system substrate-binding protein